MEHPDPDTATTYHNIAGVYDHQDNYDEALVWYHKALPVIERVLGSKYPHTMTFYRNIAVVYDHQGNRAKAQKWRQKAGVASGG